MQYKYSERFKMDHLNPPSPGKYYESKPNKFSASVDNREMYLANLKKGKGSHTFK